MSTVYNGNKLHQIEEMKVFVNEVISLLFKPITSIHLTDTVKHSVIIQDIQGFHF